MALLILDADMVMVSALQHAMVEQCLDAPADETWVYACDLVKARAKYEEEVDALCDIADCPRDDVLECFSSGSAYRRSIYPEYKKNRAGRMKPPGFKEFKAQLLNGDKAYMYEQIEADDVIGIFATWPDNGDVIVASNDKDLLQIPGKHLWKANGTMPEAEPGRTVTLINDYVLQYISPEWATRHFYTQALVGDTTDSIPGCPGVGPKRAQTALAKASTDLDYWEAVVRQYEKAFPDVSHASEQAIRMARLVRILKYGEYDFQTHRVKPWTPPIIPM